MSQQQNVIVGGRPANSSVWAGRASGGGGSVMYGHHGRRASKWTRKPLSSPLVSIRHPNCAQASLAKQRCPVRRQVGRSAHRGKMPVNFCQSLWRPGMLPVRAGDREEYQPVSRAPCDADTTPAASQRCTRRLLADSICRVLPKEVWASTSSTGAQRSNGLIRQSACHSRGQ